MADVNPLDDDKLKEAIEEQLSKVRRQNMLLGFQVCCQTVLDKIVKFESAQGKKSTNDYKRLVKDIKGFASTGISRKVNTDGTTESAAEETVQN